MSLEKEFEKLVNEVGATIKRKLQIAERAYRDAKDLADENGIPFKVNLFQYEDGVENEYTPTLFFERYSSLDIDKVSRLTGVHTDYLTNHNANAYDDSSSSDDGGWESSANC